MKQDFVPGITASARFFFLTLMGKIAKKKNRLNMHLFGSIIIIITVLLIPLMKSDASSISVTNEITSPANRTIWTNGSEGTLREAMVAINVTNNFSSHEAVTAILALDCSGSMVESDPNRFRVEAAKNFVDLMAQDNVKHMVGVVLWKDFIFGVLEPTYDLDAARRYIDYADASGYTCIGEALRAADSSFKNATTKGKVLILLSDGIAECYEGEDFVAKAKDMRSRGISIYTIGLGNSSVEDLQAIGQYYHVSRPDAMPLIFRDIATRLKTSLKNASIEYHLARNLEPYDISPKAAYSATKGSKILTWDIGDMYYKQKMSLTFKVGSGNPGNYTLAVPMNSTIAYEVVGNGSYKERIPPTNLLVKFHQTGNGGDGDGGFIQIGTPLNPEEANRLFGPRN
ncbi:MAG: VWA domain-containing protein [Methanotrichaceae archaeon]|nr:VWA domain-containing protein [Methanotrichaceae archaeon]